MVMRSFDGVADAARAIQDFLFDRDATLPDDVRNSLRELVGPTTSPVDAVVHGAKLLYARNAELSNEARELGAGLALMAAQYNFHSMAENDKGSRMALALMRDAGVKAPTGVRYPKQDSDPEPDAEFAPKSEAASNADAILTDGGDA